MNWRKIIWVGLAVALASTQLALIAAKLAGFIHWSWGWTLAPIWSPIALIAVAAVISIALFANAASNGGNPFR